MRKMNIFYIFIMIIMGVLSYLFIYDGIYMKSRIYINYEENKNIDYKVNLLDNEIYNNNSLKNSKMYISNGVKDIDFNIKYNIMFDRDVTGYYKYNNILNIIVYNESDEEKLFERVINLDDNETVLLNENNNKNISINTLSKIDFKKYRDEIIEFENLHDIKVSAYALLELNVDMVLNFEGLENTNEDNKKVTVMIPLTLDTFKIKDMDNDKDINSYYNYSNKEDVNYLLLIIGLLCISIFLSLLVLIIKNMIDVYKKENSYKREIRYILNKYDDIIINVKRMISIKKYNLKYVDSFSELLDVYYKCNNPISFREMKRNEEALFVINYNDDMWIYRLSSKKDI